MSPKHCPVSQALSMDLSMMFPCVDLDFSQIPILLEVEQHAAVLHVTGYYDHVLMLAKGKKRVFARPCRQKEPRTVLQERRGQVVQLSQRYEMFCYQYTYADILDFMCFQNKKTYYCSSKRNSSVFKVCYDSSKRKEIQGQSSLPPYCLSQRVTILNFTQLCHNQRLDP